MGGAKGTATTLEGKKQKVERVKGLLDTSQMIISVPASSLSVTEVGSLRRSLPEGTTMSVVKNKLMSRAVEGTDYECTGSLLKGANMWFFIEEDIGGTLKALKAFNKETGKEESHSVLGGVIDGQVMELAQVEQIAKLPSKLELISQIAGSIKAVPTKVARVIKEPNSKLARAIKLATADESSESD